MRIKLQNDKADPKRCFRFIIHAEFTYDDEAIFSGWEEEGEDGDPIPRDFEASPLTLQEIVREIQERYDSTLDMADCWSLQEHFTLQVLPASSVTQMEPPGEPNLAPVRQQQARGA